MVAVDNLHEFLEEVPESLQPRFRQIVQRVDRFCQERLDDEYREVCRRMLACFCQPETGIERGKAESWAAGIVYEAGQVNFLTDSSFEPCIKSDDIAKGCGVSVATMHNKGKCIREALRLTRLDPEFMVASRLEDSPLAWLMELPNGMIVDLRNLPDEVAEKLRLAGLMPEDADEPFEGDWRERKVGSRPLAESGLLYTLKITLKHTQPPIWRRVQLPDCLLEELHEVIQTAMGWEDCHMHEFVIGQRRYAATPPVDFGFGGMDDSASTEDTLLSHVIPTVSKKPFCFQYMYDFGDGWDHTIVVEQIEPLEKVSLKPVCLDGRRACPPEDCGGVWGYAHLLEALADPNHPDHAELSEWHDPINPEEFDPADVNADFKRWRLAR